jgi:tetratricopeptide (TPR) repeat protein
MQLFIRNRYINIARLGVLNLNLTQKKYFYIFRDVKQVIVFLFIVVLVGGAVAYGVWKLNQPRWMDGEFNIAVAEFNQPAASANSRVAPVASQMIFEFLDREYQLSRFGGDVQVIHDKIGFISDANDAEDLARKVNAHLVIYGDVNVIDGHALISPRFYVADTYRSDVGELTGQHKVLLPVEFDTTELIQYESEVNRELRQRSALLIEFTKGLSYLALDNLEPALRSIENAINVASKYDDFEGKEVLYLFAAIAARRMGDFETARSFIVDQALDLNSSYGRAYIALGNIYYEQKDFDKALDYYEQAAQLKDQSPGAFITEKANVGAGNSYTYLYQIADKSEQAILAEKALTHFQVAIDAYQTATDAHTRDSLKEVVALAYYSSGIIFQGENDFRQAANAYKQTLALTQNPELKKRADRRLGEVCKLPLKFLC